MKKKIVLPAAVLTLSLCLGACGGSPAATPSDAPAADLGEITVISREDGSGTRSAFVELMGVVDADDNDATYAYAEITNSTSVMLTSVAGNKSAIGYVSLGSLNDSVKAIQVDGVAASVEAIKGGSYAVARPFNIATKGEASKLSEAAADFISFILSADGQAIINEEGYISVNDSAEAYSGGGMRGKIVLAGSTSVAPVMEVLAEAYRAVNPDVELEIQQSGSGAGMTSAIDGVCDIGMASRAVKDSEKEQGLVETTIAMDGIAVVVNHENGVESLSSEQIKNIFLGETTQWADVQ